MNPTKSLFTFSHDEQVSENTAILFSTFVVTFYKSQDVFPYLQGGRSISDGQRTFSH